MPSPFEQAKKRAVADPKTWLITGVAGFIGSNLLETLLQCGQRVVGLDNFATGHRRNLEDVQAVVGDEAWGRFQFIEGDIAQLDDCRTACRAVDYVLHQAALGSVPRSIEEPITSNRANIDGFVNMLVAARDVGAKRFVYAASSATYGDHPGLPKVEDQVGNPLSPYAVTKRVNELYAHVFASCYGMEPIGLRYFNVYGARQDPEGAYAAVIPRWVAAMLSKQPCRIFGDGETSRDFCYVGDAVQANILAALSENGESVNQVYNVAYGAQTSLTQLFGLIRDELARQEGSIADLEPVYEDFRSGDVRHSLADVSKARRLLGYEPTHSVRDGLRAALRWYVEHL